MGTYVNNGKVALGSQYTYNDAVKEVASLVGVGTRSDGQVYLSDVCLADGVNMWAKNKPEDHSTPANLTESERNANAYSLAFAMDYHESSQKPLNIIKETKYIKPTTYKRFRDFNGYNHNALNPFEWGMPKYTNKMQWFVPYLLNNESDGILVNQDLLQKMCAKNDEYPNLGAYDTIGRLFVTYSGFFRDETTLSDSIDGLIDKLKDNRTGSNIRLSAPSGLSTEPNGQEGHFIFYTKKGNMYSQLLPAIKVVHEGELHPIQINGWTPKMSLRTLYNGINNAYVVGDCINNNTAVQFCKDDLLYFSFSITNNSLFVERVGSILLQTKVSYSLGADTYTKTLRTIMYDTEEGTGKIPFWSINGLGTTKGPYDHNGIYGLNRITKFPRYAIAPYSLIERLKTIDGINIPSGASFKVTFSIKYYKDSTTTTGGGQLNEEYLASSFTIPMMWINQELNNSTIPDYIKPVPPDWEIELQD